MNDFSAIMPPDAGEFLDVELLSRLPWPELRQRTPARGRYAGMRRSAFSGSGVEFKEHRDYVPGDPPARVDWKVFARSDRLHIRLTEEYTEQHTFLLVDSSASMGFERKWECARTTAAACLLLSARQLDRYLLRTDAEDSDLPASGMLHLRRQLEKLRLSPAGIFAPLRSLTAAAETLPRGTLTILISDFYFEADELAAILDRAAEKGHELLLFQVLSDSELRFGFQEPLRLTESESSSRLTLSPDAVRTEYLKRLRNHIAMVESSARARGGDYHLLDAGHPALPELFEALNRRNFGKEHRP